MITKQEKIGLKKIKLKWLCFVAIFIIIASIISGCCGIENQNIKTVTFLIGVFLLIIFGGVVQSSTCPRCKKNFYNYFFPWPLGRCHNCNLPMFGDD